MTSSIVLDSNTVALKNLNKLYSPEDGIQKSEVIDYYVKTSPLILPHIYDKPFSMIHFPEGVGGKNFYQKQCPDNAPDWLKTIRLDSSSERGYTEWCILNDSSSIVWMANRSVIEMHTWFSRLPDLSAPDIAVVDLDPSGNTVFFDALFLARAFGILLKQLNIFAIPKTSGGSGMHIYIPILPSSFNKVQSFLNKLCSIICQTYPRIATTERIVSKRGDRVYLDAVQNASGKTIIAPYSLRARKGMPVSTPLEWKELDNNKLIPADFNIKNTSGRLKQKGDLMKDFYNKAQILPEL